MEPTCADAGVTLIDADGHRRLLMVRPGDERAGWALPGGHGEPGETWLDTARRELREETGLDLPDAKWVTDQPRAVPDARFPGGQVITVLSRTHLGLQAELPKVVGGDDAAEAAWMVADSYPELVAYLAETYGDQVFDAHADMIADLLHHHRIQ